MALTFLSIVCLCAWDALPWCVGGAGKLVFMLSASAYSFRQKSRLAISLSWVAGYTNLIAFLMCGGIVISHATGNVTHLGEAIGDILTGHFAGIYRLAFFGFLVGMFFMGAVASGIMMETARLRGCKRKYIVPMSVEMLLLGAFEVGIVLHEQGLISIGQSIHFYWMSGSAAFAMGLQNATITRISGAVVRTTHVTGVVTDLGLEGIQYLFWAWARLRRGRPETAARLWRLSRRHPSVLRLALLASILGSFLVGSIAGTLAFNLWLEPALLLPILFLGWIILLDWRKPIADVHELDLTADPDFGGYESVRTILPPGVGIYRLSYHRRDVMHHAPDFQAWIDRLPRRWKVIVLAISPMTSLDVDTVLDLSAAVQKLRSARRDLVVCGIIPTQFRILHRAGFINILGMQNVCPDMDLALARAMNRLDELQTPVTRHGCGDWAGSPTFSF